MSCFVKEFDPIHRPFVCFPQTLSQVKGKTKQNIDTNKLK